jgi:predicted small secreted protein
MSISKLTALTFVAVLLAACETVQGAGQDISNAGDAITEQSREAQADL